jgi:hypothetical protein
MIKVTYDVYKSSYHIHRLLKELSKKDIMSFDVETRSIYTPEEVDYSKQILKSENLTQKEISFYKMVSKSSGLSNPRIVKTTHFIFGLSESYSKIIIAKDRRTEITVWNWLVKAKCKFLIHRSSYDLKICHQVTNKIPENFEDTQLLAKCYINNSDNWKSRVGLKVLMGSYYNPKWSMFEDYDVKDYEDVNFLSYASIDGAATYYLYWLLQQEKLNCLHEQ